MPPRRPVQKWSSAPHPVRTTFGSEDTGAAIATTGTGWAAAGCGDRIRTPSGSAVAGIGDPEDISGGPATGDSRPSAVRPPHTFRDPAGASLGKRAVRLGKYARRRGIGLRSLAALAGTRVVAVAAVAVVYRATGALRRKLRTDIFSLVVTRLQEMTVRAAARLPQQARQTQTHQNFHRSLLSFMVGASVGVDVMMGNGPGNAGVDSLNRGGVHALYRRASHRNGHPGPRRPFELPRPRVRVPRGNHEGGAGACRAFPELRVQGRPDDRRGTRGAKVHPGGLRGGAHSRNEGRSE